MIYQLRNRHFRTWIILAVLLPLGFVAALLAIPKDKFGEIISHQRPQNASVEKLSEDDLVSISILKGADNPGVEITLKQALRVPGASIFLATDDSDDINLAQMLGQIDSRNTYYFSTNGEVVHGQYLLFYDPINRTVFHKIAL